MAGSMTAIVLIAGITLARYRCVGQGREPRHLWPDGGRSVWPAHIVTEWLVFKVTTHKSATGQNRTDLASPGHLTLAIGPYARRERSR